jgi:hypothetical protein
MDIGDEAAAVADTDPQAKGGGYARTQRSVRSDANYTQIWTEFVLHGQADESDCVETFSSG